MRDFKGLPLRRQIGFIGDSKIEYGFSSYQNGAVINRSNGSQTWLASASQGRVVCPMAFSKGYAGKTSAQINALAKDALAMPVDVLCILYGANDRRSSATVAQTWQNLLDLVDMTLNAGKIPVVMSEVPKSTGSLVLTQAQGQAHYEYRMKVERELRTIFPESRVASCWDDMQAIGDPNRYARPGMLWDDGGHQANMGAQVMGRSWWAAMSDLFRRPGKFVTINDQYNADLAASASLGQNALFLTPGGQLQASAKASAGSVLASGWAAYGDQGGPDGITTDWFIEPGTGDDVGNWQCIRVRGKTTKDNAQILFTQNLPLGFLAAGDKVAAKCRVRQEGVGTNGPELSLLVNGGINLADSVNADGFFGMTPFPIKGSRETPVYTHPANTADTTELKLRVVLPVAKNVDVDYTVRIGQCAPTKQFNA